MPELTQQQAKPAPPPTTSAKPDSGALSARRDKFFLAVATAVLTRQSGRTPHSLARECVEYTDAFMAALDSPKGA